MYIEPTAHGYYAHLHFHNGASVRYGKDRMQLIMDLIEDAYETYRSQTN